MEHKLVTYKNLKIGQKIKGHEDGGYSSSYTGFVKSINSAFVVVSMWLWDGCEENIDASYMFRVEMTDEEFKQKYREQAIKVLKGINHKLNKDEIGCHEMWNAWLYGTPYEMAKYCVEENIKVIGYSSDIVPKSAMFSGDMLDIGVCAEYEDGERFWCHYRYSDIETMLESYKELL